MRKLSTTILAVALLGAATPLAAQRPDGPMRRPPAMQQRADAGPPAGALGRAELALRLRERLELSDAQVTQLEALRRDLVAARTAQMNAMFEARSQVRAGGAGREELLRRQADNIERARSEREASARRIAEVLTDEQQQQLRRAGMLAAQRRPGLAPRMRDDARGGRMLPRQRRSLDDAAPPPPAGSAPRNQLE